MKRILTALLTLTIVMAAAMAQDSVRVSLLTCAPGSQIYELEGHSALRIVTPTDDYTVNWGLFDFDSPGFVYRFVKGETDYMVGRTPTGRFLYQYARYGRRVTEQRLNLTPQQAERLIALVSENLEPDRKVYRYNYVKDNCSTRVLEMVEAAVGDTVTLAATPAEIAGCRSFRDMMAHYHRNYPWYQFGIDLALGSGIDYALPARATAFAPVVLEQLAASASLPGGEPLVGSTETLVEGTPGGVVAAPTPFYLTPLFWSVIVLLTTVGLSVRDLRRHRPSRWWDTALYGMLFIASLLICFLVFISVHEATSPNWLLLWINPFTLIGAVGIWLKNTKTAVFWWQIVNFVALTALTVIGLTGVQHLNAAFYPLIASDMIRAAIYIRLYKCQPTA